MKITHYRVKCKLKRESNDQVSIEIMEDTKEFFKEEIVKEGGSQAILSISKELSDHNEKEKTLKKRTLLNSETEAESFLILKYLTQ